MTAVEEYLKKRKRGWNMDVDGTLHLADAAIAEEAARADRAEAALETANEHERQLIEVVAQHDRHAQDARNTAARRIRRARNETNAALDRAEKAEAENERLLTRYACDVICGMGRRGNGSCSNPYDAECPALPDFIAAAKEASC